MSIEFLNESGFEGVNEEMLIDVASYAFGAMDRCHELPHG